MENRRAYNAPTVKLMKFDANDILTASNWNFNCNSYGGGDNAAPPNCDVNVTTDNTGNG